MRFRLVPFLLIFMTVPALAQDNTIRVIGDDGSVQEVKIPTAPPAPASQSAPPAGRAAPAAGPERPPVVAIEPDEIAKPLPRNKVIPMASVPPPTKAAPPKKPEAKAASAPEEVMPDAPEEPYARKAGDPPIPPHPDRARARIQARSYWPSDTPVITPQTQITKDVALQIALKDAPPARSVQVLPRTYQDRNVFVVKFRTEAGPQDVLVDAQTGEIIAAPVTQSDPVPVPAATP